VPWPLPRAATASTVATIRFEPNTLVIHPASRAGLPSQATK
jgi:hypothetical protein